MKKIIIATHHYLAKGFKDTLEYIVPNTVEVIEISAYVDNVSVDDQILAALDSFEKDEQVIVFTDLLGGSVNQEFVRKLNEYNIELITGINLPVIITIVLALGNGELSKQLIHDAIEESRTQLVYVNDFLTEQISDDEDE